VKKLRSLHSFKFSKIFQRNTVSEQLEESSHGPPMTVKSGTANIFSVSEQQMIQVTINHKM